MVGFARYRQLPSLRPARWGVAVCLLAGCASSTPEAAVDLATAPAVSPSPSSATALPATPVPPCSIRIGDRDVLLDRAQARQLTEIAAEVVRGRRSSAQAATAYAAVLPAASAPALSRSLSGRAGPTLTCDVTRRTVGEQQLGSTGLTAGAERLRQRVRTGFGDLPMGGFAAGGVSTGHVDDSSHYDGRALDIFFRPVSSANTARGWVLAHWLLAHGEENTLLSVIFSDRIWTSWASCAGWRPYEHPNGPTKDPVLRHLDHVHTAVQGPRPTDSDPAEARERARRLPSCAR